MLQDFKPVGSWVALVTPMKADGSLDREGLVRLIDRHCETGTTGILLAGTTGESAALSDADYARLLDWGAEVLDGRLPLMAGVGSPATHKAVAQARIAAQSPVDALLCVTPYYLRTTQRGLEAHFRALVDAVDLPLVLYNVPSRTAVDLLPETTANLSRLPTVAGIKEAVPDAARIEQLVARCAADFAVLSGDDGSCLRTMKAGGVGVISVTANVVPGLMARLCALAAGRHWDEAEALDRRLTPLHEALMAEPNPIPVKTLLHRLGRIGPGIRQPLLPATVELSERLAALIEQQFSSDVI